jgi:hypothetical protein
MSAARVAERMMPRVTCCPRASMCARHDARPGHSVGMCRSKSVARGEAALGTTALVE